MERYLDLLKQQGELQERIDIARDREVGEVIEAIVRTMAMYNITLDEIREAQVPQPQPANTPARSTSRRKRKRVPKYLDPASGRTWCGRGRTPKWLVGKNLDDYLLINE
ncbi:H-NS histone family protein [Burkholderia sp. BCC1977]|uniref:H-NS histone family protein n=1 Tax=Burkholderia sp. BCC1977 TaxID=2817440 RepID=UPI002ABE6888|nr:H-NS histone family protein [Burkholderia sp. BCC1977]